MHRIHVHEPSEHKATSSYRAHLDSTQHEHMADTYDGAVDGLLAYIGRLGWPKTREDYQIIDIKPGSAKPFDSASLKSPIYVHRINGRDDEWTAEPSGAPHLSGFGPTAEEALANCQSTLELHGFTKMFGDPVYC